MAGNTVAFHLNGPNGLNTPHRPQAPAHSPGAGGNVIGPPQALIHPSLAAPRAGLPMEMVGGPSVEISDVSRGLMTIADMREELTECAIFRFEKMPVKSRYDDEGKLQVPTWDRAIRTRVQGISAGEITRQIQHLNRDTCTLADKLKSLSPVLQRQIDAALEHLTSRNTDPINYHWVLAQLDHQLREITPFGTAAARSGSQRRRRRSSSGSSRSRMSGEEIKAFERVSLTAYFKRMPRPEVDIPALYETRKRIVPLPQQANHALHPTLLVNPSPNPNQNQNPNPNPNPNQSLPQHPGPGPRTLPPGAGHMGGDPMRGNLSSRPDNVRAPSVASRPNGPGPEPRPTNRVAPANNTVNGDGGMGKGTATRRVNLADDSDSSDCLSSDGTFNSKLTPHTSYSSGSFGNDANRKEGHDKNRLPIGNKGESYDGEKRGRNAPRSYAKHEEHLDMKRRSRIRSTSRLRPSSMKSPASSDRTGDDAYLVGVLHGIDNARIAQQRALHEARRLWSRPHTIPGARPPSYPHRRNPGPSNRWGDIHDEISRFNRMSLGDSDDMDNGDDGDDDDDDDSYDVVMPRADTRRRRGFGYLLQGGRGSVLDDDPFDRERPYSRHRGGWYRGPLGSDASDVDFNLSAKSRRPSRYRV